MTLKEQSRSHERLCAGYWQQVGAIKEETALGV